MRIALSSTPLILSVAATLVAWEAHVNTGYVYFTIGERIQHQLCWCAADAANVSTWCEVLTECWSQQSSFSSKVINFAEVFWPISRESTAAWHIHTYRTDTEMLFWMEKSLTFFCFGKRISTMDDYHKFDLCTACKSKPFSIQSIKCIHVHTYTQCSTCRSLCNARMHVISSHLNYEFNRIINVNYSNLTYALCM